MTTSSLPTRDELAALIDFLADDELDDNEANAIADIALGASTDPENVLKRLYGAEAVRLAQRQPEHNLALVIGIELEDLLFIADHVDTLWEEVQNVFEDSQLPDFPYENCPFSDVEGFYDWAAAQLAQHYPHYELIEFGQHYECEFQLALVKKAQVETFIDFCQRVGLPANRLDD